MLAVCLPVLLFRFSVAVVLLCVCFGLGCCVVACDLFIWCLICVADLFAFVLIWLYACGFASICLGCVDSWLLW